VLSHRSEFNPILVRLGFVMEEMAIGLPRRFSTSIVRGFWPVELAKLADGPTGCGKLARGGCSLAWNFSVTR